MGSNLGISGYSATDEDSNMTELYDYPSEKMETAYMFIKVTAFPMNLHKFLDNAGYKGIERGEDAEGFVVHTNRESQWLPTERYEKVVQRRIKGDHSGDSNYHLQKY